MNQSEVLNTFRTALNHGSSFESALGKAGILADADNKAIYERKLKKMKAEFDRKKKKEEEND